MKPLRECDIVAYSLSGKKIPIDRILATYICKDNWELNYDELKVRWVWKGPWNCAYDFSEYKLEIKEIIKVLTTNDLLEYSLSGDNIPIERILATYSCKDNWEQIEENGRSYWVWRGPWTCGYEAVSYIRMQK